MFGAQVATCVATLFAFLAAWRYADIAQEQENATDIQIVTAMHQVYAADAANQLAHESSVASEHQSRAALAETQKSNQTNREALVTVQRAFITAKAPLAIPILTENKVAGWRFQVQIENSGATPTIEAVQSNSYGYWKGDLPAGFDFKEGVDLRTAKRQVGPRNSIVIGPKQVVGTTAFDIPMALVSKFQARTNIVYMWGWVRYRDQFSDTPIHLTEFCFNGTDILGDISTQGASFQWGYCAEHNCTDENCKDYRAVLKQ